MTKPFLFLLMACICSCVPVYVPMRHNVPMHSTKNEFQGSVSVFQGFNIQTAYSITNHIGLTGNYLYANSKVRDLDGDEYTTQNVGELGIGYFNHFKENWWVEVYAGYGYGHAAAYGNDYFLLSGDEYSFSGVYQKAYIQPSMGLREGNLLTNLSIKCSLVDLTKLKFQVGGVEEISEIKPKIFIAPAGTFQFPIVDEYLYGTIQVGVNIVMGKDPAFDYQPVMCSAGLIFKTKPKN